MTNEIQQKPLDDRLVILINSNTKKKLKLKSVELDRDMSVLVRELIANFIK